MLNSRTWLFQSILMLFALLAVIWVMSLLRNPSKISSEIFQGQPASPTEEQSRKEPIRAKVQFGDPSAPSKASK